MTRRVQTMSLAADRLRVAHRRPRVSSRSQRGAVGGGASGRQSAQRRARGGLRALRIAGPSSLWAAGGALRGVAIVAPAARRAEPRCGPASGLFLAPSPGPPAPPWRSCPWLPWWPWHGHASAARRWRSGTAASTTVASATTPSASPSTWATRPLGRPRPAAACKAVSSSQAHACTSCAVQIVAFFGLTVVPLGRGPHWAARAPQGPALRPG